MTYLLMMMTSWAIVVDVWYLPPMEMRPGENSVEFAERVKHEIAKKGGLVELLWDGNLKRSKVGFISYLQRKDNLKISVRESFKLLLLSSHKLGGKDTDQIVKVSSISVIVISIGASFANTKLTIQFLVCPIFPKLTIPALR